MRTLHYEVALRGPFQEMRGTLLLQISGTEVSGTLRLGERPSYLQGRVLRRNRIAAAVRLKTEVYEEDCDLLLRLREPDGLLGSMIGEWGTWTLEGSAAKAGPEGTDLPAARNL